MRTPILIVDDEAYLLEAARRHLEKEFDVITANGGKEALEILSARPEFAVLIADMHMPGMNGLDLLIQSMQIAPDTVRIMLTGSGEQQTAMAAINQGHVFAFLRKPCPGEKLKAEIRAAVQQYHVTIADKEVARLRNNLINLLVHDMRSPLTGIQMAVDLALASENQAQRQQVLRLAKTSTEEVIDMTNQMLEIHRLEGGQMPLQKEQIAVDALVEGVLAKWTIKAPHHRLVNQSSCSTRITADLRVLARILNNLIDNAVKFTAPGGTISISSQTVEQGLIISVTDSGQGIPPELRKKLFNRFEQGNRPDPRGFGLGLTFVKLAAEAHGGHAGVESEPGQGSRFWIQLPLSLQESA